MPHCIMNNISAESKDQRRQMKPGQKYARPVLFIADIRWKCTLMILSLPQNMEQAFTSAGTQDSEHFKISQYYCGEEALARKIQPLQHFTSSHTWVARLSLFALLYQILMLAGKLISDLIQQLVIRSLSDPKQLDSEYKIPTSWNHFMPRAQSQSRTGNNFEIHKLHD